MPTTRLLPVAALAFAALAACGGDDGGGGDIAAYCESYEVLSEVDPAATDPAELEANLDEWVVALDAAVDAAPEELRDETAVLDDRFDDYIAEAEAANFDITQVDVDGFFSADDILEASEPIDAFAEDSCDS